MRFEWPYALALLLVPLLILGFYFLMLRRRRRMAVRYPSLSLLRTAIPGRSRWRRRIPFALFLLALMSLAIAVARPQAEASVPISRTTIILALDVSRSMCSTDVDPNRLAVAQEVAQKFVAEQPSGTRIGVVAFSAGAQLVVPPTSDHKVLTESIAALKTGRGTAVGTALLRSIDAISTINPNVERSDVNGAPAAASALPGGQYQPDIVVLLTDGATTQGIAPLKAAEQAVARRVRVFPIGFGTPGGGQLVCSREQLGADVFGDPFGGFGNFRVDGPPRSALRIDEATLQSIAEMTGGTYHRAQDAEQLVGVFRNLPKEIVLQKQHIEVGFGFTAAGAVLALIATGLALAWNRYS
jgi:Ca-activated chloride channel family protein